MDGARTSQTLSSDIKIDVSPKQIEDSSLKREKEGQRRIHDWVHGQGHDRASGSETGGLYRWKEKEGEIEVYLDKQNLDLDTKITTKSKLRVLKIT